MKLPLLLCLTMLGYPQSTIADDDLPAGAVARLGTTRFRLTREVRQVLFSPDEGQMAAILPSAGTRHDSIAILDSVIGRMLRVVYTGSDGRINSIAYSPNGRILAAASTQAARFWETTSWEEVRRIDAEGEKYPSRVIYSTDGMYLAMALGGEDAEYLDLVDEQTGKRLWRITGEPFYFQNITFSADSRLIAGCDGWRHLKIWECSTGRVVFDFTRQKGNPEIKSLCFAPDGAMLAAGTYGGEKNPIYLWDIVGRLGDSTVACPRRELLGHESAVNAIAFSPDGKILASGSHDETIRFWDRITGRELAKLAGHRAGIQSMDFSRDGRWLASGDCGGVIRVWDVAKRAARDPVEPNDGAVTAVAFSPDGKSIVSGGQDRLLRLWDLASRTARTIAEHPDYRVSQVAFSPDGRLVAVADGEQRRPSKRPHEIRAYDVSSGAIAFALPCGAPRITSMAFSADGRFLASASYSERARVWDLAAKTAAWEFTPLREADPDFVALSPRGDLLAVACGNVIQLWDVASRRHVRDLTGHPAQITALAFAADGSRLVSASFDCSARVWSVDTGQQIFCLGLPPANRYGAAGVLDRSILRDNGHGDRVITVVCSADGRLIATGGLDTTVRLWSMATGKHLATLTGHQGLISSLDFSPDGRLLVSASTDATMLLWDVSAALNR